mmetsp:Transcript_27089/g.65104  ORF Transcript_27089/g.65104 Transcript_27089/m.65104 type:complete len:187 (-) Transcript_27089:36-596(-)
MTLQQQQQHQHQSEQSEESYLQQLEGAILHAATTGSPESSRSIDAERRRRADGLAGPCLELLRRRGWGGGGESVGIGDSTAARRNDAVAFYALTALQRSPSLSCLPPPPPPEHHPSATHDDHHAAQLRNSLRSLLLTSISDVATLRGWPHRSDPNAKIIFGSPVRFPDKTFLEAENFGEFFWRSQK